jgi:hypothetical protein
MMGGYRSTHDRGFASVRSEPIRNLAMIVDGKHSKVSVFPGFD